MKSNVKKIIISIVIFLLYSFFSSIVLWIVKLLNIDLNSMKYIYKIIFIFGIELIPFIAIILIYRKDLVEDFKIFKAKWKKYFDKYIKYWILGIFLMSVTSSLISIITKDSIGNNEKVIRQITDILPVYSIISTCIVAPIIEELMYRKAILNIFNKKWLAIIATGLIFGSAHVIGTYERITDILYIIPYGVVGSMFMYIYYDSKNIWTTISFHFIHNFLLMSIYIIPKLF